MLSKEAFEIVNGLVTGAREKLGLSDAECHLVKNGSNGRIGYSHSLHGSDPAGPYLAVAMDDERDFCAVIEVQHNMEVLIVIAKRARGWSIDFRGPEPIVVRSARDGLRAASDSLATEIQYRLANRKR